MKINWGKAALNGSVAAIALLSTSVAWAQQRTFDIPAEDAVKAIPEFARQAGVQIVAPADQLKGVQTPAIKGALDLHDALKALLAGTGVVVASDDGQTIVLTFAKKSAENEPAPDNSKSTVETVIVTAEKREEALGDVPMSVTAISGEDLVRTQSTRFQDYIDKVPGMTLVQTSAVTNQLVLRGVSIGADSINSSVATYLDETPYTSEGPFANPGLAPNLDTYDLQRIEVLRGPQGTLYGSQALGGLLKYVTNAPDPTDFAASAQGGLSSVDHGGDGFDLHAMVNIPLSDDAALRVVGFDSFYPGYIDDPSRGLKDINGIHVSGGRASLLYAPTQNFSIRFNVLYQDIRASDTSNEDLNPGTLTPIYGNLIQERYIAQPEETKNELYNVTANWDLGFAKLLSSTSYAETPLSLVADGSSYYGALFTSIFGPPTYGGAEVAREPVYNFTQEFRLSSTTGGPLEWQVGAFFTHEYAKEYEQLFLVDPTTHQVLYNFPVNLGTYNITPTYRELAGFANLDYHITPAFDVAFGGRYSTNSQTYRQINAGLLTGADDIFNNSSQGVFTYSGDARWHWTPDTMLYARIATGFVPGGPNDVLPLSKLPLQYNSSTTINYEAGVKSSLFDDSVSIDVDVFDIDWSDIQIEALEGSLEGITNGGGAQSDGVEWNFGYVPLPGLTLNLNGSYTDARLVQALPPPAIGAAGALLPNVPMWASAASAGYERPLFGDYSGFVGASWRFSGARFSDFTDFGPRQQMPSYNMLDLRAGIETQGWTLTFYAKNVGNTIAFSSVDPTTFAGGLGPQTAPVFTPRTIGIELAANF